VTPVSLAAQPRFGTICDSVRWASLISAFFVARSAWLPSAGAADSRSAALACLAHCMSRQELAPQCANSTCRAWPSGTNRQDHVMMARDDTTHLFNGELTSSIRSHCGRQRKTL